MSYLSPLFEKLYENYDQQCEQVYPGGLPNNSDKVNQKLLDVQKHSVDRRLLAQLLLEEQELYECSPETAESIALLTASSTGVVITGQQPSVLGGMMLVFHKAMTCISLARKMSIDGAADVVPVFWIAGDDSDLKECNYVEDILADSAFRLDFENQNVLLQMSHRMLNESHHEVLKKILESMTHSNVSSEDWVDGESITLNFGRLLSKLLGHTGLILVDGASKLVQTLGRNTLIKCISNHSAVKIALRSGDNALLSLGESSPVEIRDETIRAFEVKMGGRYRVHDQEVADDARLSHDVLSRPLVCDTIFPVVAHVLGPAELRYFGVLAPLYSLFGIPFPMVVSRCHATITMNSFSELSDVLGCSIDELAHKKTSEITQGVGAKIFKDKNLQGLFAEVNVGLLEQVSKAVGSDGLKNYVEHQVGLIQKNVQMKTNKKLVDQDKALHALIQFVTLWFAKGRKQERHLNLISLLKYISFKEYCKNLDSLDTQHQYIELETEWNQ